MTPNGANGDERISVLTGNILWNMGTASKLPKAWLWFYRYLVSDGQRLDDREAMCITLLISLEEGHDSTGLRLDDLPATAPLKTLRNYQTHWKQMGLLFTARQFYSPQQVHRYFGSNAPAQPRFKNTIFDLTNLFYNISLVAQEWARRNAEYRAEQEQCGIENPKPYSFPDDYEHEIVLSPEVAKHIVTGAYERGRAGRDFSEEGQKRWYVPPKWWYTAHDMFGLSPNLVQRERDDIVLEQIEEGSLLCQVPQNGALGSTQVPQNRALGNAKYPKMGHLAMSKCPKTGHSLIKEKEEKKGENDISLLLDRFAARKNDPSYHSGPDERRKVESLLAEGYSVEQISAAIEQAFDTRVPGAKPVRGFGFIVTYIHQHPASGLTEDPKRCHSPHEVPVQTVTGELYPTERSLEPARETTGDIAEDPPMTMSDGDPLNRIWDLLQAASVRGIEGVPDAVYDLPGVRIGLRQFLEGSPPFSPDEVYDAVTAGVSRGGAVPPDRLVGYVRAVLENARREAREQERMGRCEGEAEPDESETDTNAALAAPSGTSSPEVKAAAIWQSALEELRAQMTAQMFDTWIRQTRLVNWTPGDNGAAVQAVIGAPTEYNKSWLENRMIVPIQRTLSDIAGKSVEVQFVTTGGK